MSARSRMPQGTPRSRRQSHARWLTASVCCISAVSIGEVQADPADDPRDLETVIVTAQKRSEKLQEVPIPVTVIAPTQLVASNQLRLEDYYTKLPGLSLTLAGNGSEPSIAVRGVKTGSVSNPTVGVVVDDVSYGVSVTTGFAPSVADIDPGDLARVELLRGPQGTLYGASSMGGLLKFVTVDPSTERFSGRVQVGSTTVEDGDTGYSVRGSVNVPLSDSLAVRASAFTVRDPGYVDNIQTNKKDVNERQSDGGRLSALWRASESLTVKLSALVQESDRLGTPDADLRLGNGDLRQRMLPGAGRYERRSEVLSAVVEASLGDIDLTSVTGYSSDKSLSVIDQFTAWRSQALQFFGVAGAVLPANIEAEKFSQEVRLDIPLGDRVNWLVGGFYMDEDTQATTDIQAADAATGAVAGSLLLTDLISPYKEYAFFTNVTVDVTDRLDVQVGGRWSENESSFQNRRRGPLSVSFFGSDPFISPKYQSKDNPVTYLLTPRFKFNQDMMAYLRLASGYRPGGPNAACGIINTPCQYDADTTQTYEFGFKGEVLNRTLTFDASLYYIDWKDVQIRVLHPTVRGIGYTVNQARAESQGVELSVQAKPLSGLTVSAWAAFSEAELAEALPPTSTTFGRKGDVLPYNSRWSGNFSVDQAFPLWDQADGSVGVSVSYVDERTGEFVGSTARRETFPEYTQVDVHASVSYETWVLNAFLNNATDKRGVLRGGVDGINPFHTYIQPRTVGLSLAKSF